MPRRRNGDDEDEDAPRPRGASSRGTSSTDEELAAIQSCVAALDGLDEDQAANVIAYLTRRYNADV
jgi:hypothetical protein